jgi:hypothetical protein
MAKDREALRAANWNISLDADPDKTGFYNRLGPEMTATFTQALQNKGLLNPAHKGLPQQLGRSLRRSGFTPGWGDGVLQFGGLFGILVVAFASLLGWRPVMRLLALEEAAFFPFVVL